MLRWTRQLGTVVVLVTFAASAWSQTGELHRPGGFARG